MARFSRHRSLIPYTERASSQRTMVNNSKQMAPYPKEILNKSVYREKPLPVRGGSEPAHLSLAVASVDATLPLDCSRTAGCCESRTA